MSPVQIFPHVGFFKAISRLHHILTENIDDPEAIHGAPCSIQIVGRHMQDEALMNAVEIVAGVLDA